MNPAAAFRVLETGRTRTPSCSTKAWVKPWDPC